MIKNGLGLGFRDNGVDSSGIGGLVVRIMQDYEGSLSDRLVRPSAS